MQNMAAFKGYFAILFFLLSIQFTGIAQKGQFIGMLEYKITARDTALQALYPENKMLLYTNDTIVRVENFTSQLGKQVTLRHIEKNKSYLLLSTAFGNFAIQTDLNKQPDSTKISKYTFEKKCFKRKIAGRKANRIIASHEDFKEPIEFWYFKDIDSKYHDTFEGIPGLPVKYSVATPDVIYDYELVKVLEYTPDRDLFGVPSDYERISFDDFLDKLIQSKGQSSEQPE